MKSAICSKLHLTLVATILAVTLSATATSAVAQAQNKNEVGGNGNASHTHSDGAEPSRLESLNVETHSLNQEPLLIAQVGGLWCYTYFGRFPMMVQSPVGIQCTVPVSFYPGYVLGIVGY